MLAREDSRRFLAYLPVPVGAPPPRVQGMPIPAPATASLKIGPIWMVAQYLADAGSIMR